MADREFIITPIDVAIEFRLEQASMFENSLHLLGSTDMSSGYGSWILETRDALTDAEWVRHKVVMQAQYNLVKFTPDMTFPQYIEVLTDISPKKMATKAVEWIDTHAELPSSIEAMQTFDTYLAVIESHYAKKRETKGYDLQVDVDETRLMYDMLQKPDALHAMVIDHLTMMWNRFIKPEWDKQKPLLQEAVKVHGQANYDDMSPYEVIEQVTGRDVRGNSYFNDLIDQSTRLIFCPSPHVGPYIGFHQDKPNQVTRMFFGARLPKGSSVESQALSRSELLVRLNALADDTRLRMMELLIEHGELCAQDFINLLDLSQSSASRHLRQLTASGYLKERRKEVAKCYQLNTDRIEDTLSALHRYLVRDK